MRTFFTALGVAVVAAYPLLVYAGLKFLRPVHVAATIGVVAAIRLVSQGRLRRVAGAVRMPWQAAAVLVFAAAAVWLQRERLVLFTPAIINAGLLVTFGGSLLRPPPLVERFARVHAPDLSNEEVSYCRTVTIVWCAFFVVNATVSVLTAAFGSLETWTLYNGFIAYAAIGALFGAEMTYRYWRFRRYAGAFTDPLFRKLFPPRQGQ